MLAVFDGHRGNEVSIFCKVVLPKLIEKNMEDLKEEVGSKDLVKVTLKKSVEDLDSVIQSSVGQLIMGFIVASSGVGWHNGYFFNMTENDRFFSDARSFDKMIN